MGKNRQQNKPNQKSELKISAQKRNELNSIVDSILKLGFKQSANINEQFQVYSEIQSLLDRVVVIESVLKVKTPAKSRKSSIDVFTKWVRENGGKFDGIVISEFPGYDLGLEATKPFKEDDLIIEIPQKLIMCDDTCMPEEVQEVVKMIPMLEKMKNVRLAFSLIYEKVGQSFWKPYLDILPEKYNTVMNFSVTEMQELKGSNTFGNTLNQCISIARQYAVIYKSIQSGGNKVFEILKEKFTYEFYRFSI
ncbi:SETD3 family protein [Megaselia abdita]